MSDTEFETKRSRIHKYLVDLGYEALILGHPRNFSWLTGGYSNAVDSSAECGTGLLYIDAKQARLITNRIEAPRMQAEVMQDLPLELVVLEWHEQGAWGKAIRRDRKIRRIAGDVTIPGAGINRAPRPIWSMQVPLLPSEIERYRRLGEDAGAVVGDVCLAAEPGWTEYQVAGAVARGLRERGIQAPVLLVGADGRLDSFRHPVPSDLQIRKRFMIVVCAERHGLIANLSRLVSFGAVSDAIRERQQQVCDVDAAMIAASRPGVELREVFARAMEAYEAIGFPDEWLNHHQGGTTGFNTRDVIATPESTETLVAGQAVAWNPSLPSVKSEDTFLVTDDGVELLTPTPDWPMLQAGQGEAKIPRPAILER